MTIRAFFICLIFIVFSTTAVMANPFLKKKEISPQTVQTPKVQQPSKTTELSPLQRVMRESAQIQRTLRIKLSAFIRDIRQNPTGRTYSLFLLFAFIYGSLHALGPGHGKAVCCSWVAAKNVPVRQAILMSSVLSTVHVLSATLTVSIAGYIIGRFNAGKNFSLPLERISYSLLLLIGCLLLFSELKELFSKNTKKIHSSFSQKEMLSTAFITGLVPCPAAALVLGYALMQGLALAGYTAMIFMALGMAVTTSIFAGCTAASCRSVLSVSHTRPQLYSIVSTTLHLGGPLLIITVAWLLFCGTLA